jgi:hypothetical protein
VAIAVGMKKAIAECIPIVASCPPINTIDKQVLYRPRADLPNELATTMLIRSPEITMKAKLPRLQRPSRRIEEDAGVFMSATNTRFS